MTCQHNKLKEENILTDNERPVYKIIKNMRFAKTLAIVFLLSRSRLDIRNCSMRPSITYSTHNKGRNKYYISMLKLQ